MTPSLEGSPTKAKEAPSPHEVRLVPLDNNPVFQCLAEFQCPCLAIKYIHDIFCIILQVAVSVGTMQLTLSIVIMQVPTSVAFLKVSRFYCNYVGNTFMHVRVSVAIM